jgi:HAD superfamily hydrolase (TIGR01509 family)
MQIAAIIFDMDGLMLDTERIAQLAWQRAARDHGYDFPDTVFRGVVGLKLPDVEAYIRRNLGDDFPFLPVYHSKQARVAQYVAENGLPLKPGLLELLDAIDARRLKKAVASSSPRRTIDQNLERLGLAGRFDALVGGDQIERGKPAPDIFLAAARHLEISPQACLVLEDSNAGVQAAHAAGMYTVMIPDMVPPAPAARALAHHILLSLKDVIDLLPRDSFTPN